VLAFAREGYKWSNVNLRDLAESLCYPGLWKFLAKYPSMCGYEIRRSLSRAEFTRSLQKLVPEIRESDLETGGAGVRAQAMLRDGKMVEDFHFQEAPGVLHVVNAPSPAATASLAIGRKISGRVLAQF
jgi:L-2-hydroxyglutarate oxidase